MLKFLQLVLGVALCSACVYPLIMLEWQRYLNCLHRATQDYIVNAELLQREACKDAQLRRRYSKRVLCDEAEEENMVLPSQRALFDWWMSSEWVHWYIMLRSLFKTVAGSYLLIAGAVIAGVYVGIAYYMKHRTEMQSRRMLIQSQERMLSTLMDSPLLLTTAQPNPRTTQYSPGTIHRHDHSARQQHVDYTEQHDKDNPARSRQMYWAHQ